MLASAMLLAIGVGVPLSAALAARALREYMRECFFPR